MEEQEIVDAAKKRLADAKERASSVAIALKLAKEAEESAQKVLSIAKSNAASSKKSREAAQKQHNTLMKQVDEWPSEMAKRRAFSATKALKLVTAAEESAQNVLSIANTNAELSKESTEAVQIQHNALVEDLGYAEKGLKRIQQQMIVAAKKRLADAKEQASSAANALGLAKEAGSSSQNQSRV